MEKYTEQINNEIDKHKWITSEKIGHDIGMRTARIDWLINHWGKFTAYFDQKESKSND